MRAQIDEHHLIDANTRFWEQMLAMKLDPEPIERQFCVGQNHLRGRIDLMGAWKGRVEIRMAEDLARTATAAMMMQAAETVTETDMMDAISEVTNMIAGVLKSSLPQPCSMGLPRTAVERCNFCAVPPGQNIIDVAFRHTDGKMVVRVFEEE